MLTQFLGWLTGLESLQSIDSMRVSLAAPWAQNGPAWVLFGCAAVAMLALVFYTRWQASARKKTQTVLAVSRAVLLVALVLILADPVLRMDFTSRPRPLLYVLFDGTESMEIQDEMSEADRARLAAAVGLSITGGASERPSSDAANRNPQPSISVTARPSRIEYVKAFITRANDNLLSRLEDKFRVETFILDRPDGVRKLNPP
jgi:hypothetical protein